MAGRSREDVRRRTLLAQECARIMAEEGIRDFLGAKRKAAQRLGVDSRSAMPNNVEIEAALREYQRLFHGDRQPQRLQRLRETALEAMRFFARFRPRLVGPVLAGTAGPAATVDLHLFADTPEDVALFLMGSEIPFESGERRFRLGSGEHASYPSYAFVAGEAAVGLTVFPPEAEREAPRSPVDGRPMHRAGLREVEALLRSDEGAGMGNGV